MNKQEIISNFDPNQPGLAEGTLFGLPFDAIQSEIIIVPAPWEVTVSYGAGASKGVVAVLDASFQVDLAHQEFPDLWKLGIFLDDQRPDWKNQSDTFKSLAHTIILALENGKKISDYDELQTILDSVNEAGRLFKEEIKDRTLYWLDKGKKVGLLGGDHSTPLGYYEALATKYSEFGILHLDAHMDLRKAYEGFTYSHASIMYNALEIPQLKSIVQVGVRDFCEQEVDMIKKQKGRVKVFSDLELKKDSFNGKTWREQCDEIISFLPEKVHISFDIDGLYPWYCPHTGTPVPGGFSFEQATYLLSSLADSGREIIGFDLVEVAPGDDDWDGNVGARMLFHLCGVLAKSQKLETGQKIEF